LPIRANKCYTDNSDWHDCNGHAINRRRRLPGSVTVTEREGSRVRVGMARWTVHSCRPAPTRALADG